MREDTKHEVISILIATVIFFVLAAFVVTVSLVAFLNRLEYTEEQIRSAAPVTAIIIGMITVLFVIQYAVIRYFTVLCPMRKIQAHLEEVTSGVFVERLSETGQYGTFDRIVPSINRMTEELSSAEILKMDFVSNISHELKTPLSVIRNYGNLLMAESVSDEDRIYDAKTIVAASGRMSELITNILRLNRLENQELLAKREVYDLSAQLSDCLLQFETIWEEKEIELEVDIADDVTICSDRELLEIVWNNIMTNAFKFTEDRGTVGVRLCEEGDSVIVSISDTGCGMDEKTGRHIFDKFYQGDTSHAAQGNGLGLALVKRVVDLVDGRITVQSTLGEGSTFTVQLKRLSGGKG